MRIGCLGLALLATLAGCSGSEEAMVTIRYTLEPEKGLPAGLDAVAIAPAELGPATDAKWSDITADMLQQKVEEARQEYGVQLRVADRQETRKVFEEEDLAAAGLLQNSDLQNPAKLLNVQAFLVSKVNIKEDVRRGSQTVISGFDFRGRYGGGVDTREVEKVKKTVTAQAVFKLVDAKTGETWMLHEDSETSTEESDASPIFGSGEGEAELTMTDEIARRLIERVATEFLSKLVPVEVERTYEVESSHNEACARGVALLRADLYGEALEQLKIAMAEDPEDHKAMFAAGVACERMGDYEQALTYYKRALVEKVRDEYLDAKSRLERDLPRIREGA